MQDLLVSVPIPADDDVRAEGWKEADARRMHRAYSNAFRGYLDGQRVQDLSIGDAAEALSKSAIAVELAAGLDLWALVRRDQGVADDLTKKLERLARRLDADDAWRNDLRDLIPDAESKRGDLEALAQEADYERLPTLSIILLGEVLWSVDSRKTAMEVFRRGRLVHPKDFGLCFRLALMRELGGRWSTEVVSEYSTAAAIRPEMNEAWHRLGNSLGCVGRHDEAEEVFRMLAKRDPDHVHWQRHIGTSLQNQGRSGDAIAVYQGILEKNPGMAHVHNCMGVAYSSLNQQQEALECYRRAVKLEPTLAMAHANIGSILAELGDPERGIEAVQLALKHDPKLGFARQTLRGQLLQLGRRDEAIASHRAWLEFEPDRAQVHFELGQMLQNSGELEGAIECYRSAEELFANSSEGGAQQAAANTGTWIQTVQKAIDRRPQLLAIARGQVQSSSAKDLLSAAMAAYHEDEYVASVRAFEKSFAASSGQIKNSYTNRYNWVCAMIRAAGRHGVDAQGLSQDECKKLRADAYRYLAWHLKREIGYISDRPSYVARGRTRLSLWKYDNDLADVREEESLDRLPPEEAEKWRELWRDVQATLLQTDKVRLMAIARGEAEATSALEWLYAADVAYDQKEYSAAAGTFSAALAAHPEMLEVYPHRYNLACSLALAAAGEGLDAGDLTEEWRSEMRAEALDWLTAEFAMEQRRLGELEPGEAFYKLVQSLKWWTRDPDFASVRGEALAALPPAEAAPWREFWKELRAVIARAEKRE